MVHKTECRFVVNPGNNTYVHHQGLDEQILVYTYLKGYSAIKKINN